MKKPQLFIKLKRIDETVIDVPIKRSEGYELGYVHHYKLGGRWEYCAELKTYKRLKGDNGRLYIGQAEGNVTAVSFFGTAVPDAPGENYACLLRTHLYSEGHKTLVGGINIPWMWVIIGVAVVVVAVVGFKLIGGSDEPPVEAEPIPIEERMEEGF